VSEWIGWVGRLRRTIYARMEQLSFRTGAATFSGVVAVAVTAILLTLTQPGHHAAPLREVRADAPVSSVAAPPVAPFSLPATHRAATRKAAPFTDYEPAPAKKPKAAPQASPSPDWPTPLPQPTRHPATMNPSAAPPPGGGGGPWPFPTPTEPFSYPQAGPASAGQ
jgi:hypothetical protein